MTTFHVKSPEFGRLAMDRGLESFDEDESLCFEVVSGQYTSPTDPRFRGTVEATLVQKGIPFRFIEKEGGTWVVIPKPPTGEVSDSDWVAGLLGISLW